MVYLRPVSNLGQFTDLFVLGFLLLFVWVAEEASRKQLTGCHISYRVDTMCCEKPGSKNWLQLDTCRN